MNCSYCEITYNSDTIENVYNGISTVGVLSDVPGEEGNVIFIPRKHVRDAASSPELTAELVSCAAQYVAQLRRRPGANREDGYQIVINIGDAAGQEIHHLSASLITVAAS